MASYKYGTYLAQSTHEAFDQDHGPGSAAPYAGIYRCMGCHREIGIASGHILPPQNDHTHTAAQGTIRWRLIVCANRVFDQETSIDFAFLAAVVVGRSVTTFCLRDPGMGRRQSRGRFLG